MESKKRETERETSEGGLYSGLRIRISDMFAPGGEATAYAATLSCGAIGSHF